MTIYILLVALVPGANAGWALAVSEIILDADGRSWPDVSAWYWSAALGESRGPWLAVTASRRISATGEGH